MNTTLLFNGMSGSDIWIILGIYASFSISMRIYRLYKLSNLQPPATFLLKVAGSLPKKQSQGLTQEISDMRLEYYEALSEKKIWRARCIVVFYYIGLCWSIIMWISDKIKEITGIVPKKD